MIGAGGAILGLTLGGDEPFDDREASSVSASETSTTTLPRPDSASTPPGETDGPPVESDGEPATGSTTSTSADRTGVGQSSAGQAGDDQAGDDQTGASQTTEAGSTAAESDDPSTGPGPVSDPVARFRELVDRADLDSGLLTDRDVQDFGQMLCFIATVEDPGGYRAVRDQLAAEEVADSALTVEEVVVTIDAAVASFCPDEATRLGLSS